MSSEASELGDAGREASGHGRWHGGRADGKAELKTFIDNGAQTVGGRTDLVTLEGVGFRRAKDQFIFGQIVEAVSAVREDVLTSAYANDTAALARVDVDIAAFKQAMPERYDAFSRGTRRRRRRKDDDAQQAGADLVIGLIRELTRVGVFARPLRGRRPAAEHHRRRRSRRLKSRRPGIPRPGFPQGTIFRADLAHPPAKVLARITSTVSTLIERDEDFAKLTAPQQEQVRSLASDVAKFVLGGDAGSVGVEAVKEQVVVYWVTRQSAEGAKRDVAKEITALAARADEVAKLTKQAKPFLVDR